MSFVDLHIHSEYSSDGEWRVARICKEAMRVPLAAFAVSDHDSVAAIPEALEYTAQLDCELIPNVEISTEFQEQEFHLLAPLLDWRSPLLARTLEEIKRKRDSQARARVEKLRKLGLEITYEQVLKEVGDNPVTGPSIAQAVLKNRKNSSHPLVKRGGYLEKRSPAMAFYLDFFTPGKQAYVEKKDLPLGEAIAMVRDLKGVPVLAHPGQRPGQVDRDFLERLKEIGLEGIEVYSSYHDRDQTRQYGRLAESLGLLATAGSDFHGRMKPHVAFGSMREKTYELVEDLEARREQI